LTRLEEQNSLSMLAPSKPSCSENTDNGAVLRSVRLVRVLSASVRRDIRNRQKGMMCDSFESIQAMVDRTRKRPDHDVNMQEGRIVSIDKTRHPVI